MTSKPAATNTQAPPHEQGMSTGQKALSAVFAGALGWYFYAALRQAGREVTPLPLPIYDENASSDGGAGDERHPTAARLRLVNFDQAEADEFAIIFPSWSGVVRNARPEEATILADDAVSTALDDARSEARQAWAAAQREAEEEEHNSASQSAAGAASGRFRAATVTMRTTVEIAGTAERDVMMSPVEVARVCQGAPMEVACVIALATGPDYQDVDLIRCRVEGRVTSPEFLELLAAARRKNLAHPVTARLIASLISDEDFAAYSSSLRSASSADESAAEGEGSSDASGAGAGAGGATAGTALAALLEATASFSQLNLQNASASNFLTMEDLFEPRLSTTLIDDTQLDWQKLFANLPREAFRASRRSGRNGDDNTAASGGGEQAAAAAAEEEEENVGGVCEAFVERWRRAKLADASRVPRASSPRRQFHRMQLQEQHEQQQAMTSLLLAPWRYRAYVQLANAVMYGQLERRYGSLFSGVSRGFGHAASAARSLLSVSPTGLIAETGRGIKNWFRSFFSSSSPSTNSNNANGGNADQQQENFSSHCRKDFGYDSQDPLAAQFRIEIVVRVGLEDLLRPRQGDDEHTHEDEVVYAFARHLGLKVEQTAELMTTQQKLLTVSFDMLGRVERCTAAAFDLSLQLQMLPHCGIEILRIKVNMHVSDIRRAMMIREQDRRDHGQPQIGGGGAAAGQGAASSSSSSSSSAMPAPPEMLKPCLLYDGAGLGLCPVYDEQAANPAFMTGKQYFNFTFEVALPPPSQQHQHDDPRSTPLSVLHGVCAAHGAFFSAIRESGSCFVALRLGAGMGLLTCLKKAEELKRDIDRGLERWFFENENEAGDADSKGENTLCVVDSEGFYTIFDTDARF